VIGRHNRDIHKGIPLSPIASYSEILVYQALGGNPANGADDLRFDKRKLCPKKGKAHLNLIVLRISIAGRMAFDHIADIDLISLQSHRPNYVIQQLSRCPNKGPASEILFHSRGLANKDEFGMVRPFAKHNGVPCFTQLATIARVNKALQFIETLTPKVFSRRWLLRLKSGPEVRMTLWTHIGGIETNLFPIY
jgi:hypothetical protein